jgi:hypothetical protein
MASIVRGDNYKNPTGSKIVGGRRLIFLRGVQGGADIAGLGGPGGSTGALKSNFLASERGAGS